MKTYGFESLGAAPSPQPSPIRWAREGRSALGGGADPDCTERVQGVPSPVGRERVRVRGCAVTLHRTDAPHLGVLAAGSKRYRGQRSAADPHPSPLPSDGRGRTGWCRLEHSLRTGERCRQAAEGQDEGHMTDNLWSEQYETNWRSLSE